MGKVQPVRQVTTCSSSLMWVYLQGRRRAAEPNCESTRGRLPAATARLCHHCFPRPPSGPHKLCLQVASVFTHQPPPTRSGGLQQPARESAVFMQGDCSLFLTGPFRNSAKILRFPKDTAGAPICTVLKSQLPLWFQSALMLEAKTAAMFFRKTFFDFPAGVKTLRHSTFHLK